LEAKRPEHALKIQVRGHINVASGFRRLREASPGKQNRESQLELCAEVRYRDDLYFVPGHATSSTTPPQSVSSYQSKLTLAWYIPQNGLRRILNKLSSLCGRCASGRAQGWHEVRANENLLGHPDPWIEAAATAPGAQKLDWVEIEIGGVLS